MSKFTYRFARLWTSPLTLFLALAACGQPEPSRNSASEHKARWSSIQAAMTEAVDPSADTLWAAVSSVETAGGEEKAEPQSAEDWRSLAVHAEALLEAADFLDTLPPAVAAGQMKVADADVAGTRSASQIDADIKADPARFRAAVATFRHASRDIQTAVKARDIPAFFEAGEKLDASCDGCHFQYWHPQVKRWEIPSVSDFKQHQL